MVSKRTKNVLKTALIKNLDKSNLQKIHEIQRSEFIRDLANQIDPGLGFPEDVEESTMLEALAVDSRLKINCASCRLDRCMGCWSLGFKQLKYHSSHLDSV
ncbi:MAG: hypothetical protein ACTSRU_13130 [Candidatus Hodarchaeales archaeon]